MAGDVVGVSEFFDPERVDFFEAFDLATFDQAVWLWADVEKQITIAADGVGAVVDHKSGLELAQHVDYGDAVGLVACLGHIEPKGQKRTLVFLDT